MKNKMLKRTNGLSVSNLVQIYSDIWACLFLQRSWNLGRIFETATLIFLSTSIRACYLVLITAMAENPASYKYDVAKRTSIRNALFIKAGYSSFNEIQKFVRLTELNFLFKELSQVRSMKSSFTLVKEDGIS